MTFKTFLMLAGIATTTVLASCKDKLTTLTERYTKELNGNFRFTKRTWVSGEQQPPVDTNFDIVVLHDSLLKIGSVELPLHHGSLAYKSVVVWDDNLHYMLFGQDDTSGMVFLKYFYGTSTIDLEDHSANTIIRYTQVK